MQGLPSKRVSYCAASSWIICLTNVIGIDFKTAVLILYYQTVQQH